MVHKHFGDYTEIRIGFPPKEQSFTLKKFGQSLDISEADAAEIVKQGARIVPEGEFQKANFTKEELSKYSTLAAHVNAPAEFLAKVDGLKQFHKSWRESLTPPEGVSHE